MMDPAMRQAWVIQGRVIRALVLREVLTRYGRRNLGFLWLFVEPLMFTGLMAAAWTAARDFHRSDLPIVAFAISGYPCLFLVRNLPSRCMGALSSNAGLLYHRHVLPFDIYVARIILEWVGVTASMLVLLMVATLCDLAPMPRDPVLMLAGWLALSVFSISLALLLGPLAERIVVLSRLWTPVSFLMMPLSGALVLVDALPPAVQPWVLMLPIAHGVEMFRDGYFGQFFQPHYDLLYPFACSAVMLLLGLWLQRTVEVGEK